MAGRSKNTACDIASGEKYLGESSKQVSDEEACKKSCEDAAACKSITFYSSGWCSHFSTECTKTKADGNAISIRLSRAATTTASPAGWLIHREILIVGTRARNHIRVSKVSMRKRTAPIRCSYSYRILTPTPTHYTRRREIHMGGQVQEQCVRRGLWREIPGRVVEASVGRRGMQKVL